MSSNFSFENLWAWMLQILLFGSVAAVLPLLLRLRHPRTQLAYCHLALLTCLALPWLQNWRHPIIVNDAYGLPPSRIAAIAPVVPHPAPTSIPWQRIAVWILV